MPARALFLLSSFCVLLLMCGCDSDSRQARKEMLSAVATLKVNISGGTLEEFRASRNKVEVLCEAHPKAFQGLPIARLRQLSSACEVVWSEADARSGAMLSPRVSRHVAAVQVIDPNWEMPVVSRYEEMKSNRNFYASFQTKSAARQIIDECDRLLPLLR